MAQVDYFALRRSPEGEDDATKHRRERFLREVVEFDSAIWDLIQVRQHCLKTPETIYNDSLPHPIVSHCFR
jgi:hypothetical protein